MYFSLQFIFLQSPSSYPSWWPSCDRGVVLYNMRYMEYIIWTWPWLTVSLCRPRSIHWAPFWTLWLRCTFLVLKEYAVWLGCQLETSLLTRQISTDKKHNRWFRWETSWWPQARSRQARQGGSSWSQKDKRRYLTVFEGCRQHFFFFYMLSHVSLIKSLRNRNHHPHLIDEEVGDVDRWSDLLKTWSQT